MSNSSDKKITASDLIKLLAFVAIAITGGMLLVDVAWAGAVASKFDVDAGVAAAANPLISAIENHWGKGIILTGASAALFGEGDGRQRAIRAGIAAGAGGGVVLGLIAMLK